MCRALGVTRQGHCQWAPGPTSVHDLRDPEPARLVGDEHEAGMGTCGAPKILARPEAAGVPASRKRVMRMMREHGWRGVTRACARRPSGERRASKADSHDDPAGRDLASDGPDKAWFADVTYVRTHQGRPCLAVVMGVWSRMTVGWSMGPRATAGLADGALKMAIARRGPAGGRMHHGDHGARYVSLLLGKAMRDDGIRPSMGSMSSPWDDAITESPMGVVRSECVHARTFESRGRATLALFDCMGRFHDGLRIRSALGWLSPAGFEAANEPGDRSSAA